MDKTKDLARTSVENIGYQPLNHTPRQQLYQCKGREECAHRGERKCFVGMPESVVQAFRNGSAAISCAAEINPAYEDTLKKKALTLSVKY